MTAGPADGFARSADGSGDEDFFTVPVQVLACWSLGAFGEEYQLAQRWSAVVLPGQRVALDGVGQWPGEVDAQSTIDCQHASVEGHVVSRAGGQAVAGVKTLGRCAVFPWLDVAGQEHPGGAERGGLQAAKHTTAAAV